MTQNISTLIRQAGSFTLKHRLTLKVSPVARNYNISIRVEEVNATQSDSIEMTIEVIDGIDPPNFPLLVVVEQCLMLLIPPLPAALVRIQKVFYLTDLTRKIPL